MVPVSHKKPEGPDFGLIQGDAAELLPDIPSSSVDSLVTDPPSGIGFMAKDWDMNKGGRGPWVAWLSGILKECFRILKPGAHALIWALPRTSHWTMSAVEDSGFEIRDVITHLFGTGYPKNKDISARIDSAKKVPRIVVGQQTRKVYPPGVVLAGRQARTVTRPLTIATSPEAKQWSGWGTALKPSGENWVLARKPLQGRIEDNILRHGTGGLNIEASKVEGKSWPMNTVFSHHPECTPGKCGIWCPVEGLRIQHPEADNFFYTSKPSMKEKTSDGEIENHHCTVKSVELMRYLCRLITPPAGIILDPFTGSGTTGVAALQEGFSFFGIEQEGDYFATAQKRLLRASEG